MKEDIVIGATKSKDQRKSRNNQLDVDNFDSQDKYTPRIKKSMSDGKFKTYGAVTGATGTFRR